MLKALGSIPSNTQEEIRKRMYGAELDSKQNPEACMTSFHQATVMYAAQGEVLSFPGVSLASSSTMPNTYRGSQ